MHSSPDESFDRALESWISVVLGRWGASDAAALREALIAAGARHANLVDPERLGAALAAHGVRLETAHDWLAGLPADRVGRRIRRQLLAPTALVRLTTGWADAAAARGDLNATMEGFPRLLHDHLRRVADEGPGPDVAVVVATAGRPSPGATERIAEAAAAVFAAGEPIARSVSGNVVVLARRDDALQGCLDHFVRVMTVDPNLDVADVRVWVEPVGRSAALLDALRIDVGA